MSCGSGRSAGASGGTRGSSAAMDMDRSPRWARRAGRRAATAIYRRFGGMQGWRDGLCHPAAGAVSKPGQRQTDRLVAPILKFFLDDAVHAVHESIGQILAVFTFHVERVLILVEDVVILVPYRHQVYAAKPSHTPARISSQTLRACRDAWSRQRPPLSATSSNVTTMSRIAALETSHFERNASSAISFSTLGHLPARLNTPWDVARAGARCLK